jgi:hypothetical protein
MFGVACPHCGQRFAYVESLEGQTVACTTCQNQFVMQGGNVPSPPTPPAITPAVPGDDSMPPIVTNRPTSRLPRRKPDNTIAIVLACVAGGAMIVALGGFAMMATESQSTDLRHGEAVPASVPRDLAVAGFGTLAFIVIALLGLGIYAIPSIIAFNRGHQNATAILALNILLGWTFLGWVGSLVWALTEVRTRHNTHYHYERH